VQILIGYDIQLDFPKPTAMLGLLHTYPNRYNMVQPEKFNIDPPIQYELFSDKFGNCCTKLMAPTGKLSLKNEAIIEVNGDLDRIDLDAEELPPYELPYDILEFLYPSRYCEADRLQDFSWKQFGHIPSGYKRALAICNWVHHHIKFDYAYASNTKSACDVLEDGKGVCRDFAHLAIALCRSLGIPARYVTGYLGDIGVPKDPAPMDFSAWLEVYLSNGWYTFDPRHNKRRIGRIVIAYGRDAADVAITTTFGAHRLNYFSVHTKEICN